VSSFATGRGVVSVTGTGVGVTPGVAVGWGVKVAEGSSRGLSAAEQAASSRHSVSMKVVQKTFFTEFSSNCFFAGTTMI
jgi:hypothetical protein